MTTVCLQLVEQCEDEELMDIVLPRLTKILSVWELLLAKVHMCTYTVLCIETVYWCTCTVCTHSIHITREGNLSSLGLGMFPVLPVQFGGAWMSFTASF